MSEPDDKNADKKPTPSESGSVDVAFSATQLDAVPAEVRGDASQPVTSGKVAVPVASGDSGAVAVAGRSRRITQAVQGVVSGGVEKLGTGVEKLGEGVTRLGEAIPLVGAGVSKLGEGIAKAGESIHVLPRVAQTRRGRMHVRSTLVGFVLVFAWIAAIIAWQVRGNVPPDLRPDVEKILIELSKGQTGIENVYDHASPRLFELEPKEQFVDNMMDMRKTLGEFRELTAINETIMTRGPTGRLARVSLTASYEKGLCQGNVTFHWDEGKWKLIGIQMETPPDLKVTKEDREARVKACDDPMNPKTCELYRVADKILHDVHEGAAGAVWDAADDIFKSQEPREKFEQLQQERVKILGKYLRIVSVTEAKQTSGTYTRGGSNDVHTEARYSATYDVLAEFEKSSGVSVVFGFARASEKAPWQLDSFKVVLPMPRADEGTAAPTVVPAQGPGSNAARAAAGSAAR